MLAHKDHGYAAEHLDTLQPMPERGLLVAIVERAIKDQYSPQRDIQADAVFWLRHRSPRPRAWSCQWICEVVGVSHKSLIIALETAHERLEAEYKDPLTAKIRHVRKGNVLTGKVRIKRNGKHSGRSGRIVPAN